MNKTLITLALAATVASGSAMAWTAHGSAGVFELGGSLNPVKKVTPWEVKLGDASTDLDADVQIGQKVVKVRVENTIPVLGIRTKENKAFTGQPGISPQIDFGNAINLENFSAGVTTLTLAIKGTDKVNIGTLQVPFSTAGFASWKRRDSGDGGAGSLFSDNAGSGFFGGLAKIDKLANSYSLTTAKILMADIADNFDRQGFNAGERDNVSFTHGVTDYSGLYACGIESGREIQITLDSPASAYAPLKWKASLPIMVTYI